MRRRIRASLLVLMLLSTIPAAQSRSGRGRTRTHVDQNTRLAPELGGYASVMDGGVLIGVDELAQGQDLNGNGQLNDVVLAFHDTATGEGVNLGVAGFLDETRPTVALVQLPESEQGVDYNHDGDELDTVMGVFRPGIGLDVIPFDSAQTAFAGDDWVFFSLDELRNGGEDVNGDGDAMDYVLYGYRVSTGDLFRTRVATYPFAFLAGDAGRCAFLADELSAGEDLNGNGTTSDQVAFLADAEAGTVQNLGLAALPYGMILRGRRLWFVVSEAGQGADLDGDGDSLDAVVHAYDRATGVTTNVGYSTAGFYYGFAASGGQYLFKTLERDHGDLNGDGDLLDEIAIVHDAATNVATVLGVAANDLYGDRQALLAFTARESKQSADLNGDGDLLDYDVAFVYDPAAHTLSNLGLALQPLAGTKLAVGGDRVLLDVDEASQGGQDLNGDGDTLDAVPRLLERGGAVHELGLASRFAYAKRGLMLFYVEESAQGGQDLNGDGDATDVVTFALTGRSVVPENLGVTGGPVDLGSDSFTYRLSESSVGVDLNGDGDQLDDVSQVLTFFQEKP